MELGGTPGFSAIAEAAAASAVLGIPHPVYWAMVSRDLDVNGMNLVVLYPERNKLSD